MLLVSLYSVCEEVKCRGMKVNILGCGELILRPTSYYIIDNSFSCSKF